MSSVNLGRIKQIRPKTNGGFGTSIPLGVDGLLTDMVSGLDLEEELKLGGNHYVQIYETTTSTIIKEWYFSQKMGSNTLEDMRQNNKVTHSVYIAIVSAIEYRIWDGVSDILWSNNDTDGIVERVAISSNDQRIQMSLYQGDMEAEQPHLLHQKVITITEQNDNTTVSEQVDYNEGGEGD